MSFLQPSPCFQLVLPRVGDNVICIITRENHECCVHLLQHELQVLYASLLIRRNRQEFKIDDFCRDFRRLFSKQTTPTSSQTPGSSQQRMPPSSPTTVENVEEWNSVEVSSCRGSSQWINGCVDNRSGFGEEDDSNTREVEGRELVLVSNVL